MSKTIIIGILIMILGSGMVVAEAKCPDTLPTSISGFTRSPSTGGDIATYTSQDGTRTVRCYELETDPAKRWAWANPAGSDFPAVYAASSPTDVNQIGVRSSTEGGEGSANQQAEPTTTSISNAVFADNAKTRINVTIADGETVQVPSMFFSSALVVNATTKEVTIDQDKLNGLLKNLQINSDGSFSFSIDKAASKESNLDRGEWTVIPMRNDDGTVAGYIFNRKGGTIWSPLSTTLVVREAGGSVIVDNPQTNSQKIYGPDGTLIYYCHPLLSYGICNPLGKCEDGNYVNCYPSGADANSKPIIITGNGTIRDAFMADRCYFNGNTLSYDAEMGSCVGITKDVLGVANIIIVNSTGGQRSVTYNDTDRKNPTCTDSTGAACTEDIFNKLESQVFQARLSLGITEGLGEAAQIGQFVNLGKTYGWWKVDPSFLLYERLFEQVVLLRWIAEPERLICQELNTAYDDLATGGFLPTPSGSSGADIQAERYHFEEINLTTGNVSESYYRYKVTYNVNGQAILKMPDADMEGEYLQKYETSIQVFLDDHNLTKKIDICVGDCGDNKPSSSGTTSLGRPLIIRSDKVFTKACIKFYDTGDMNSVVKEYLEGTHGNKICNDVKEAYVPAKAVKPLAGTTGGEEPANETGGGGSGGSGGGGSGGSGELII